MTTSVDCFSMKFKLKSSCVINVPIKDLGIKSSTTVFFTIRRNIGITVKRLMTLTLQKKLYSRLIRKPKNNHRKM